jgi:hypothetical protein
VGRVVGRYPRWDGPPVSASQPLTGDELAAIKARVWEVRARGLIRPNLSLDQAERLVAEVERLRAQVERVEALHQPETTTGDRGEDVVVCTSCMDSHMARASWPCRTAEASR